jgi:hypothetical protein
VSNAIRPGTPSGHPGPGQLNDNSSQVRGTNGNFSPKSAGGTPPPVLPPAAEVEREASYRKGYTDGFKDALDALNHGHATVSRLFKFLNDTLLPAWRFRRNPSIGNAPYPPKYRPEPE